MRACLTMLLAAGSCLAAPVPRPNGGEPAEQLAGTWVETSVVYGGEDLFTPPGNGTQMMTFDGTKFREHLKGGRTIAEGAFKVARAKDGTIQLDLPGSVWVRQPGTNRIVGRRAVTHAAIVRFDGKGGMSVCYYDPDLVEPGTKRPTEFASTATNGAVLITLRRLPPDR